MSVDPAAAPGTPAALRPAKVFCIGFQKTGTTSLGLALERLGYRVGGYNAFRALAARPAVTLDEIRDHALAIVDRFDAVKDTPWPLFYREFEARYPDARFIHVVRDTDAWLASALGDFAHHANALHQAIYGCPFPKGHEAIWRERYERHNREAEAWGADRPKRYLRLSLDAGEVGWARVAPFLGHAIPDAPWPKANTRSAKRVNTFIWRWRGRLRQLAGG